MRRFRILFLVLPVMICFACNPKPTTDPGTDASLGQEVSQVGNVENPDSAIIELKNGNLRYVTDKSLAYRGLGAERKATAQKQKPFAVVVCCSDSRVPPEEVFDQGIGDLFVVRVAGEVVDETAMGSIEYAVEHLGTRLVVVLGHERCGAVTAAVSGGEVPGHIGSIVEEIKPAVQASKDLAGDKVDNAIHANIDHIVKKIAESEPILKEFTHNGELKVVGAYYDLDEGTVAFK